MHKLAAADLMSLEQYARERPAFRARVLEHKRRAAARRRAACHLELRGSPHGAVPGAGDAARRAHLRAEGIAEELDAYNPLIPDGSNWKVTLLLEYPTRPSGQRRSRDCKGIEDRCWMQVAGQARVYAIADEDLERENAEKTSAVHFLRFELDAAMIAGLQGWRGARRRRRSPELPSRRRPAAGARSAAHCLPICA